MGKLSGFKPSKLANTLRNKLGIELGKGGDLVGWYYLDGKKRLRVTVPKGHSGELSKGTANKVRGNLRLTKEDFRRLYDCPMRGQDFEQHVRDLVGKGVV